MALATGMGFPPCEHGSDRRTAGGHAGGLPADTGQVPVYGADNITVHTLSLKKGSRILLENFTIPSQRRWRDAGLRQRCPCGRRTSTPTTCTGKNICPAALKTPDGAYPEPKGCIISTSWRSCTASSRMGAGGVHQMVDPVHQRIERVFHTKYPTEYIQRAKSWRKISPPSVNSMRT